MSLTDDDLSHLARDLADQLGIAGAQIAVMAASDLLEGRAGVTNIDTGVPVTPDTLFQIGSTTKVYTAALVVGLAAEGLIELDEPVVNQLPGFRLSDPRALEELTPRHLMSMSSGMDNGPYEDHGRGDDALARYVEAMAGVPHSFRPGTGFGYSNASTNVSGRLVEHVTGKTWEAVLHERLLQPAGLACSASSMEEVSYRRVALGHTPAVANAPGNLVPHWALPRSLGPAGSSLCSSAGDLVRFAHLFLRDGRALDGARVLDASCVRQMQAKEVLVPPTGLAEWWGLGPYGKVWDGVEIFGHSGTNLAGSSYLLWAPDRDVAVATTVNVPGRGYEFAAEVFRELFAAAADITVPRAAGEPSPPAHVPVDTSRLVGTYWMSSVTLIVEEGAGGLTLAQKADEGDVPPGPLRPLTPTTFLPTDSRIDGGRGWSLAFLGSDAGPATHLMNGVFALRRVA